MGRQYFAHPKPRRGNGDWESQWEHALCTSELAGRIGEPLGIGSEMRMAGLLHDLGKSSDGFQAVLRGANSRFDHWTSGALLPWVLKLKRRSGLTFYTALAIRAHHKGLDDGSWDSFEYLTRNIRPYPADRQLPREDPSELLERLLDGHPLPDHAQVDTGTEDPSRSYRFQAASMLDIRMRLSVLVDADWTATASHFFRDQNGERVFPEAPPALQAERALALLEAELHRLGQQARGSPEVLEARRQLIESCINAAPMSTGLFTLTSPTGSGKTLAMLRFALEHSRIHGLHRIIVVLPYLTIIEQSARTYAELLQTLSSSANPYLFQDHSLAEAPYDGDEEDHLPYLRPNWSQPLIVTTSVQFFHSLFAADPGRCRKLHSLANSVVLFDEAQTLPRNVVIPTLAALSHLCARYNTSVVFSTATQPAFEHFGDQVRELAGTGWAPREIVPKSLGLHEKLRRVKVHWPELTRIPGGSYIKTRSLEEIAEQMVQVRRCLCILNTKRQVARLFHILKERQVPVFCITTNLCPKHREDVLASIKEVLRAAEPDKQKDGEHTNTNDKNAAPCLCIATQCVEAGVDIDFPMVLREWAPLPSLAQAAGRCNRHGLLPCGDFHVFKLDESPAPDKAYKQGMSVAESLFCLKEGQMDLFDPDLYREYDCHLYGLGEGAASDDRLVGAVRTRRFDAVAREYRLIDDSTCAVLVPYDSSEFDDLREQAMKGGINGKWERRARMMAVNIYRPADHSHVLDVLIPVGLGKGSRPGESPDWFILNDQKYYDPQLGLDLPKLQSLMLM
jgi:CRISPR-associated endonuclease/helicase Cas3